MRNTVEIDVYTIDGGETPFRPHRGRAETLALMSGDSDCSVIIRAGGHDYEVTIDDLFAAVETLRRE